MHSAFLTYKSSRIHYRKGGEGNQLLLCFHGYGESAESFGFLEGPLGKDFTILAIDMPFHGRTDWKEGLFFSPEDLIAFIGEIVPGLAVADSGWYLVGYSMGGRVALQLLEMIPEKIRKMVLIAPDGLRMNGWYWLATQTLPGNRLFRWTMERPGWFFLILRIGNALKLVNRSIYKFTIHYIGDRQVRSDLYQRWTTMRGFKPDHHIIHKAVLENDIRIRLLYGRYDRIIRWERAEAFLHGIEPCAELVVLDTGHQLLQEHNLDTLLGLLKG
jgi:pimeloyl-ACP methyl ester carboxylesterase